MDDDFDFRYDEPREDNWLGASIERDRLEIMCADNARASLPRGEAVKLALLILAHFRPDILA